MATRDELVQSTYMNGTTDFGGKREITVKVIESEVETLKTLDGKENTKCVLYFGPVHGQKALKPLPLNVTNLDSMFEITGATDTKDFVGHRITLFKTKATMGGKVHDAIRIRAAATAAKAKAVVSDDGPPDDGAPFNDGTDIDFSSDEAA